MCFALILINENSRFIIESITDVLHFASQDQAVVKRDVLSARMRRESARALITLVAVFQQKNVRLILNDTLNFELTPKVK